MATLHEETRYHKKYIVLRVRGQIRARVQGITLEEARQRFSENGDIRENTKQTNLSYVREIAITRRKQQNIKIPPRPFQYWVTVDVDGKRATARSRTITGKQDIARAKHEALTNAYQIATDYTKSYQEITDEDIASATIRNEGIVYYAKK